MEKNISCGIECGWYMEVNYFKKSAITLKNIFRRKQSKLLVFEAPLFVASLAESSSFCVFDYIRKIAIHCNHNRKA